MQSWQPFGEQNSVVLSSRISGCPTLGNWEQMLFWSITIFSPGLVEHEDFKTYFLKMKVLRIFQGFSRLGYRVLYRRLQNLSSPSRKLILDLLSPSFHSILKGVKKAFIVISANIPFIWLWGGAALGKGNIPGSRPLCSTASGAEKKGCFPVRKQQPYAQEWKNAYSTYSHELPLSPVAYLKLF